MKNKIKKCLLYISLLPYLYTISMCIYYAINGYGYYLGKVAYGFVAIGNFLGDFFVTVTDYFFNPISLFIIVLWISYQIYYFISFNNTKKEYEKRSSKKVNLKKIFFIISIACWVLYFLSGIWAFIFGSNTGGRTFFAYDRIWI